MPETERFSAVETFMDQGSHSVDLKLGEKTEIPFTGGEIIYATTDLGKKVIIKKTLYNEQARHEWLGLNIAHSSGVSTPKPVALINYTADQLAIVSNFIEGDNLYYHPNPAVKPEIGRQIKKMHQNAQVGGNTWVSTGRSSFVYYDRYVFNWTSGEIEELNANSKTIAILTELTDAMGQFCTKSTPTFNHNDLHDGQVIVNSSGVPIIIDFGNWLEETWLNDVGYYLFHLVRIDRAETEDFNNFLSGYHEKEKLSDIERSNLAYYLLFISSRALTYFYKRHSTYLPIAKETHNKVLAHLNTETIWKSY